MDKDVGSPPAVYADAPHGPDTERESSPGQVVRNDSNGSRLPLVHENSVVSGAVEEGAAIPGGRESAPPTASHKDEGLQKRGGKKPVPWGEEAAAGSNGAEEGEETGEHGGHGAAAGSMDARGSMSKRKAGAPGDGLAPSGSGPGLQPVPVERNEPTFGAEALHQLRMAGPMMLSFVLQLLVYLVSLSFVGHTGSAQLAAASLASSVATSTGVATMEGLAGAVETYCGQAFGARQLADMGVYTQRGFLVLGGLAVPVAGLWLSLEPLLKLLGRDAQLARMTGEYIRWLVPGLFMQAVLQSMTRFLQAQEITLPLMAASALVLAVHVPLNYVLIFPLGVGYTGAAIAISVSSALNVALLSAYIRFSGRCRATWRGWNLRAACRDLPAFVKLGASSAVMTCLTYWLFDTLTITSGWLPDPEVQISVLAILTSLLGFSYQVPLGIASAASTRVGNELGAGRPLVARMALRVSLVLVVAQALLQVWALVAFRGVIGSVFSNDPKVVKGVSRLMAVQSVLTFFDALQGCMGGTIRGCGRQNTAALINVVCYYFIGLPIALLLAFKGHLKIMGLWLGCVAGSGLQNIAYGKLLSSTDWEAMSQRAIERVGHEEYNEAGTPPVNGERSGHDPANTHAIDLASDNTGHKNVLNTSADGPGHIYV